MKINKNMINSLSGQINNIDKKIFKRIQNNEDCLLYVRIIIKHKLESSYRSLHIR